MPSGGRRPGAGRPAGKPNRESRERIERATGLTWEQIAEQRRQWLASMGFVEVRRPPRKRPPESDSEPGAV